MKQNNNWFIGLGILLALLLTGAKEPEVKKNPKCSFPGKYCRFLPSIYVKGVIVSSVLIPVHRFVGGHAMPKLPE
jgi:hypothetical protein